MRIDLHAHTTASDGTDTPTELVAAAAAAGLDVVAVTDHDTTDGWDEAAEAVERHAMTLVRGIEVSCRWEGISLHVLGYLHDPRFAPLVDELRAARESRDSRARRITDLLAADLPVTWDDVVARVAPGATVGRPHVADALVARGIVPDRDAAFARYLHEGSPYVVSHYAPDPVDAVRLIREAGGVAVMAHPFAESRGPSVPDTLIADMAAAGLFGLEARHPDHTDGQEGHAVGLARDLGITVTGSSDYHGDGKRNRLGQRMTDPEVFEALVAQASATPAIVRPGA